jgi:hypothetical protein
MLVKRGHRENAGKEVIDSPRDAAFCVDRQFRRRTFGLECLSRISGASTGKTCRPAAKAVFSQVAIHLGFGIFTTDLDRSPHEVELLQF